MPGLLALRRIAGSLPQSHPACVLARDRAYSRPWRLEAHADIVHALGILHAPSCISLRRTCFSPAQETFTRQRPEAARWFSRRAGPIAESRISASSSPRAARDALARARRLCAHCARAPRFSGLPAVIWAVRCDIGALSVCALSVSVGQSELGSEVRSPVRHLYQTLTSVRPNHESSILRRPAFERPSTWSA